MLRQRKLRDRLVAMAAPLILISVAAAVATLLAPEANRPIVAAAALAATAAAAVWSFVVGWTLIRSINSLAIAIDGVAEAQLGIANGHLEVSELPSIEHQGPEDEIGRVAKAVDAISASAVEMADAQRETIRKGLATIVINLARRNQSLLDRQVEYLDKLEQTEEDPDRLAQLFRVDHLATRMRRNAESLLVLAGADTAKRKGAPVAMSDVLRVAIGEVENYQHIELGVVEDGDVPAGVAVDLAHLTAELMENATQFSPPSTNVVVSAVVDRPTQSVHVSVADRGMGLGDRLEQANETLADPPELGLGMGRSLGFMVIGRLAKRLGATVELRANDGGGTVAEVRIPLRLFQLEQAAQPAAPAQQLPPLNQPPATPTPAGPPQAQTPPQPAPSPHPAAAPIPGPAPATPTPAPASADATNQGAASTALDKLLGIAPKTPTPPPAPAPAPSPAVGFTPPPVDPALDPGNGLDQAVPAGEALPPPADDPTWDSMTVESGPAADVPTWTPPPMPPAADPFPGHPASGASIPAEPTGPSVAPEEPAVDRFPPVEPNPAGFPPAEPGPPSFTPTDPGLPGLSPTGAGPAEQWTPPPMPPSGQPAGETWTPPPMPPPASAGESWSAPPMPPSPPTPPTPPMPPTPVEPPSRFEEAVPSGDAFDSGVASLLGSAPSPAADPQRGPAPTGWPDTGQQPPMPPPSLQKRERGASNVPIGQGRPVAAPTRSPEEVRAMLSRYRQGLKSGGNQAPPPGTTSADNEHKDGER